MAGEQPPAFCPAIVVLQRQHELGEVDKAKEEGGEEDASPQ